MILNTKETDYMGPMAYNKELKEYIEKNGTLASEELPLELDEGETKLCRDIIILHVPSGKVSAYSCYATLDKDITIFNGFFHEAIENDLSELKWVYANKQIQKIGNYTDKKQ